MTQKHRHKVTYFWQRSIYNFITVEGEYKLHFVQSVLFGQHTWSTEEQLVEKYYHAAINSYGDPGMDSSPHLAIIVY